MQVSRQILEITSSTLSIQLPETFINHKVEIIILTLDETKNTQSIKKHRIPPASIAGKAKILGDLVEPIFPEQDFECLN
jgi:hypothetical protein